MSAYYNEMEPYAAQWLRNLIDKGLIAKGEVDERSILDVDSADLRGFTQCHFFAGIGGWSLAARLAGWPDERPLWTGSAPCQPFSTAGQQKGTADERHLWPVFFGLIRACRPPVVMGEQVAAAVGKDWLDGVCLDLEGIGYACGAVVVPACAVDAPHRRDRLWFVADCEGAGREARSGDCLRIEPQSVTGLAACESDALALANAAIRADIGSQSRASVRSVAAVDGASDARDVANAARERGYGRQDTAGASGWAGVEAGGSPVADALFVGRQGPGALGRPSDSTAGDDGQASDAVNAGAGFWSGHRWAIGADGKARRVEPSIRLLAHGVPARVGKLRAYGNAIVPQVAAEVIGAYLDAAP